MKKLLLAAIALLACVGMASAAEITLDFKTNEYGLTRETENTAPYIANGTKVEYDGITVTLYNNGGNGFRLWKDGLRAYKSSTFSVACSTAKIVKVEISANKNTFDLAENQPGKYTVDTGVWEGDASSVTFAATHTSSNAAIATLTITTDGVGDTRKDAAISFPESTYTAKLGEEFTSPVATKATTAALVYTSSADEVATVNATTGEVEILAAGTAVITASAEANEEFKAGEASYTLVVVDPNVIYTGLTTGYDDWTVDNGTLPEGLTYVWSFDSSYGYAKASAYISSTKTNYATSATLTSPEFDLTDYEDLSLSFEMVGNFFKGTAADECAVKISVDGGEYTALDVNWPEKNGWTPWVATNLDLNAYAGKKIRVQFLYTSTAEKAGTWEVKNFVLKGKSTAVPASVIYSGLSTKENYEAEWTINDGTLPEGLSYVWSWYNNENCAKATGFYKQGYTTEATLTSTEIDLAGYEDITLHFEVVTNFFASNNVKASDMCAVKIGADGGEFAPLEVTWPEKDGWSPWVENAIDINAYAGKKVKVQFCYTSTPEAAGTLEVRNVVIDGKEATTGVAEVKVEDVDAPVEYFNLQGVRIANPANGLYIRRQGNKVTKVYIR